MSSLRVLWGYGHAGHEPGRDDYDIVDRVGAIGDRAIEAKVE
jgi:hypothetical protein